MSDGIYLLIVLICFNSITLFYSLPNSSFLKQSSKRNANLKKPIIAVVTNPVNLTDQSGMHSHVSWHYIRWLEDAGARVVPLHYDYSESETIQLLKKVNGLLFQGADMFIPGGKVFKLAEFLIKEAPKMKIPIWGNCIGNQILHAISSDISYIIQTPGVNTALANEIDFKNIKNSKMFHYFSAKDIQNYQNPEEFPTLHVSSRGVSPIAYEESENLSKILKPTSYAYYKNGVKYVSSAESKDPGSDLKLYSVEFHPEKIPYAHEYVNSEAMNLSALRISQRILLEYIKDARKTMKTNFMTHEEEENFGVISSRTHLPNKTTRANRAYYQFFDRHLIQIPALLESEVFK